MGEPDANSIKTALDRLRERLPAVFGSECHGFRLNSPATEEDVVALELRHGIRLPEEYRNFLLRVGNGGAGPFYGVFRLGETDRDFGYCTWEDQDGAVGNLASPFQFEETWNDLAGRPTVELLERDEEQYWAQQEAFELRYWSSALVDGAIPISHEGCAIRILLVVSGPQRGYLWRDSRSELTGLAPVRLADGRRATFFDWYQSWLEARR